MPVLKEAVRSLAEVLDGFAAEGVLYEKLPKDRVRCYACGHRCVIPEGHRGICQVRFNKGGRLFVPRGYVAGLNNDPTEKKPFYHVLPGSYTLTFGMLGCDYHCPYCQNWLTSQALRDPVAGIEPTPIGSQQLVSLARRSGSQLIGSSYNEPLITSEWSVEIFKLAKAHNLRTLYVSNGNATKEVLEYLRPWLDCFKVDLKTMSDRNYRKLGGVLDRVLESIRMAWEMGFWVEVVTLVVPGFNDSDEELKEMARFLVSVSPDIPWHLTAFHRDYKMYQPSDTSPGKLVHAATLGREEGLRYVYAGNLPGSVGPFENTFCPGCQELLVERFGYHILRYRITGQGRCPRCATPIAGIWWESP